jgi:glutamine cyclotransferase
MRKSLIGSLIFLCACQGGDVPESDPDIVTPHIETPEAIAISYKIIKQLPHDTAAYTQGLEIFNGKLYEGTGDYEQTSLRINNRNSGNVEYRNILGKREIFGEGITILNNKLYQLTWENHQVFVYDLKNLAVPEKTLTWPYEGWGLTNDGKFLIISDGSSTLYTVNPSDMKVISTTSVRDHLGPVNMINELEMAEGFLYANVYQSNQIIKINPSSGLVVGKMTFNGLLSAHEIVPDRTDVLNGIAYDSISKTFLITGKRWPKMFEIKLD